MQVVSMCCQELQTLDVSDFLKYPLQVGRLEAGGLAVCGILFGCFFLLT